MGNGSAFVLFGNPAVTPVDKDISECVVAGNPVQQVWLYCENSPTASRFGVWDCQPGTHRATMDGIIEFCYILEGSAHVTNLDDGSQRTVNAGDAFVMEPGLRTEWAVDNYVKKVFAICDVKA